MDGPDDREITAHILMPVPAPAPFPGPSVSSIWDYTGLPAKVIKSYGSLPWACTRCGYVMISKCIVHVLLFSLKRQPGFLSRCVVTSTFDIGTMRSS